MKPLLDDADSRGHAEAADEFQPDDNAGQQVCSGCVRIEFGRSQCGGNDGDTGVQGWRRRGVSS